MKIDYSVECDIKGNQKRLILLSDESQAERYQLEVLSNETGIELRHGILIMEIK